MGADGHTASLFPNTDALNEIQKCCIKPSTSIGYPKNYIDVSYTFGCKRSTCIVQGEKKEEIINEIYTNKGGSYPITKIAKEHPNFKWLIA